MFRAVVLSTLLTLVIGQNAAAFCSVRCEPRDAATAGCEHHAPAALHLFAANDRCSEMAFRLVAFVRDDAPRASSVPSTAYAIVVSYWHNALPLRHNPSAYERRQQSPLNPSLDIALRI